MSQTPLSTAADATLRDAARRMCDRRVGSILVMDGDRLIGIMTERDVLRAFANGDFEAQVGDVMTRHPETAEPDESLEQARIVMLHGGFRHLPVIEAGVVVGVLSMRDLLAAESVDQAPRGV
jgi:CBS domain-containing protein